MEAQQRAEIITYARKMIVTMGVKSLRMDDVAQATRVSKRTLYETFGDKEELLFLAAQEHFDIFNQSNMKAVRKAPNVLIAMLIVMEEIRKHADVNWQIRTTLRKFYPKVSERLWSDRADLKRKIVADSITSAIRQGYIKDDINVDLTLNMFTYIALGISENNEMLTIPDSISADDAFEEVLVTYMRGVSTIKGIESIDSYIKNRKNE